MARRAYRPFETLFSVFSMWGRKESLSSIVTPRNFVMLTLWMCVSLIRMFSGSLVLGVRLVDVFLVDIIPDQNSDPEL